MLDYLHAGIAACRGIYSRGALRHGRDRHLIAMIGDMAVPVDLLLPATQEREMAQVCADYG